MAQRDGEHLVGRRHLQIERAGQLALEARDVIVGDVAAVLAQVRRDAVGARLDGEVRGAHGIGMPAATRVADGGDVVDVHAQAKIGRLTHVGRPGEARGTIYSAGAGARFIIRSRQPRTTFLEI